ncbi:MAG: QueT transporter family protein [Lachnospiraceae bacterium]|nr:QueT transporter family protein [Lachnospiraceae bacterium]
MSNENKDQILSTRLITEGAIIAGLYVVLSLNPLSFKEVQCRFGEALCMTILFSPAGAWGMVIGCFLTNLLGGAHWLDTVFGTLATLTAVLFTLPIASRLRSKYGSGLGIKHSLLIPLPTVISNAVIIPFVLYYGYGVNTMWFATAKWAVLGLMAFSVGAGEILSCYILGPVVVKIMKTVIDRNSKLKD